ncbi:MAG: 4-hydroxythreonine-4-phosphate dehydrogenase PdxA [Acidobacteriota bacterium]
MSAARSLRIGVTVGDPAGIGPEVTVKALAALWPEALDTHTLILFASKEFVTQSARRAGVSLRLQSLKDLSPDPARGVFCLEGPYAMATRPGKPSSASVRATLTALGDAARYATGGHLDAIVTAPVNKGAISRHSEQAFIGQTEFVAGVAGARKYAMAFFSQRLKIVLLTAHLPLRRAIRVADGALLAQKIDLFAGALQRLGIKSPRIAVAGLNPHASEGGLFGDEEQRWITPAVRQYRRRRKSIHLEGPLSPDTVFFRTLSGEFDGVVALYHDQGLIPLKLFGPGHAANVTLGLPFVRTSPDHGTAYELAGKNAADPRGMEEALRWAVRLATKSRP